MNRLLTSRRVRWALPVLVASAMAGAALTITGGAGASGRPTLPPKSAAQLLSLVEQAHPQSLSGTIVQTAHLGLPSLPTGDAAGSDLSLQGLLTGSHTVRIWYDGPTRQRLAMLAPMSERDVIHNGTDLWTYTSVTNTVTHSKVARSLPSPGPGITDVTPMQAARRALHAVDASTAVSVDVTARVAGRAAYQLVLTPRDSRSLVSSVRIAIDAETSVPLRVQVFGSGSQPAIEVGFTDVSFGQPSASIFDFVPPSGATVQQQSVGAALFGGGMPSSEGSSSESTTGHRPVPDHAHPRTLGSGWTSVVELPGALSSNGGPSDLLDHLTTAVPGGRLIKTALISVLITPGGDVYVGSVSGADLQRVAATGHGL